MAQKRTTSQRPRGLSLVEKITAIVNAAGSGTLPDVQLVKMLNLYAEGAKAGEALFWSDVEAGEAWLPDDPEVALFTLAIYMKLAMETVPRAPRKPTDVSPDEVVPVMQMILDVPDWKPSDRWPFTREQMAKTLDHLKEYVIPGHDVVPGAAAIAKRNIRKMN